MVNMMTLKKTKVVNMKNIFIVFVMSLLTACVAISPNHTSSVTAPTENISLPVKLSDEVMEVWTCRHFPGGREDLLTATVNKGHKSGVIHFANVKYKTTYRLDGLNRNWEFGEFTRKKNWLNSNYKYRYHLKIEPNGFARYKDAQELSSLNFMCRK